MSEIVAKSMAKKAVEKKLPKYILIEEFISTMGEWKFCWNIKKKWNGILIMEKNNDFIEKLVHINRITKVVKGGRRFGFSALVVVGSKMEKLE